jgi:hypothetical protein
VFRNFPTQSQILSLRTTHRKRGDLLVQNFVIVTPAHPEVPSRNWDIPVLKNMEKCGDLDPPIC